MLTCLDMGANNVADHCGSLPSKLDCRISFSSFVTHNFLNFLIFDFVN